MEKKRVIIVDDSQFIVKQLVSFFDKELNFEVVATGRDGNEAIELYDKHKPDLITLDVVMPEKGGRDALTEILAKHPHANVMVISAVCDDEILKCMTLGARSYAEKPLKLGNQEYVEDFKLTIQEIFKDHPVSE